MIWVLLILGHHIFFYEGSANGGLAHEKCVEAKAILDITEHTVGRCYEVMRRDRT